MIAVLAPKRTAKDRILSALSDRSWKALHEFCLVGVSESACGARLRELTQAGITETRTREGRHFKEWKLAKMDQEYDFGNCPCCHDTTSMILNR